MKSKWWMGLALSSLLVVSACGDAEAPDEETSEDDNGSAAAETENGDSVTAEGEITYIALEDDQFNPYDDPLYTLSGVNPEDDLFVTFPSEEDIEVFDYIEIKGTYDGIDEATGVPLVIGDSLEKVEPPEDFVSLADYEYEETSNLDDLSVISEKMYVWEDGHIPTLNYYAEITNEGEDPLNASNLSITWYDDNGGVAKVTDAGIYTYPEVIAPGETAYVSLWDFNTSEKENITDAELLITPQYAESYNEELTVENTNYETGTDQDGIPTMEVLGEVVNDSGTEIYHTTIYSIFRNENGDFLGFATTSNDSTLQDGQKTGFEITDQYVPYDLIENIAEVETKAFGSLQDNSY